MSSRVLAESALRVSDCVTELLRKQPFFGSLVLRLPLRPDPERARRWRRTGTRSAIRRAGWRTPIRTSSRPRWRAWSWPAP